MPFNTSKTFHFQLLPILANVPHAGGVYGIFNQNVWIYVGEAADVHARLIEHLNGTDPISQQIRSNVPTGFVFEPVPLQPSRVTRVSQLISELRPVFNVAANKL
jgi:excinuclease UvrABC nuclease subunit